MAEDLKEYHDWLKKRENFYSSEEKKFKNLSERTVGNGKKININNANMAWGQADSLSEARVELERKFRDILGLDEDED